MGLMRIMGEQATETAHGTVDVAAGPKGEILAKRNEGEIMDVKADGTIHAGNQEGPLSAKQIKEARIYVNDVIKLGAKLSNHKVLSQSEMFELGEITGRASRVANKTTGHTPG